MRNERKVAGPRPGLVLARRRGQGLLLFVGAERVEITIDDVVVNAAGQLQNVYVRVDAGEKVVILRKELLAKAAAASRVTPRASA